MSLKGQLAEYRAGWYQRVPAGRQAIMQRHIDGLRAGTIARTMLKVGDQAPPIVLKNAKGATVTCSVSIGPRDLGGFGIAVKLHVRDATIAQGDLEALVREAHEKICPYSHATRNNVPVELAVEGAG